MQEILIERTETSKTYATEDHRITEIYLSPIHYHDGSSWQDQDLEFEFEIGFGPKAKKAKHQLRFLTKALRVGFAKGAFIDYALPGNPALSGNVATIADAWPHTDLVYTNQPRGIKGDIILKEAGHPASFAYPVTLTGCTAELVDNALQISADDQLVGQVPAPFAVDANGDRGPAELSYSDGILTITPDAAWLATAAYPVAVDPTTTTIQPDATAGKDSYVREALPTDNFGTQTIVMWGPASGDNYAMIQFALSSVPANSYITSAIYTPTLDYAGDATGTGLHMITSDWLESTVTWAAQPAINPVAFMTKTANGGTTWDITSLCRDWYNGVFPNYGFLLKASGGTLAQSRSSDHATAASRPKLVITSVLRPTLTQTTLNGTTGSPTAISNQVSGMTLSGVYNSAEPANMAYKQHQILDALNNVVWDSGYVAESKSPAASVSATVPDLPLVYGTKYYWRWRAKDVNGAESAWSTSGYFLCTLATPASFAVTDYPTGDFMICTWTTLSAENLSGYYVYRKKSADYAYAKITGLVTNNSYYDYAAASGQAYDYKVSAIADDGYESALSAAATDTLTVDRWMINSLVVKLSSPAKFTTPRRASSRVRTDGSYEIQDLGLLPRKASFTLRYESLAGRQAILDSLGAGVTIYYRDPQGQTFVGKIISDLTDSQWFMPLAVFYGDISFDAVEVTF